MLTGLHKYMVLTPPGQLSTMVLIVVYAGLYYLAPPSRTTVRHTRVLAQGSLPVSVCLSLCVSLCVSWCESVGLHVIGCTYQGGLACFPMQARQGLPVQASQTAAGRELSRARTRQLVNKGSALVSSRRCLMASDPPCCLPCGCCCRGMCFPQAQRLVRGGDC